MTASRHKAVLTTGEVAKLCNVAPRTVSKWFDAGHLRGYRIPGSKDRRIPLDQLVRFMRAHGIPLNGLESTARRVLLVDADAGLADAVRAALVGPSGYDVAVAYTALEAGAAIAEFKPAVVVVDVTMPDMTPERVVRFLRGAGLAGRIRLIGTASGLSAAEGEALRQAGFDATLPKPFDAGALVSALEADDPPGPSDPL
jgi:excisionase family DNA binding protein